MQVFQKFINRIPFILFVCLTQSIQVAGVVVIAMINKAPIQCVIIYIGMIMTRNLFGSSFHAKSFWMCTAVSWGTFYMLTASAPPLFACISGAAFLGIAVSYFMHHLQNYLTLIDNSRRGFILRKHCDKDELYQACKANGLTDYDYTLLCTRYVDCLSGAQLEIKFGQSQQNVRKLIREAETKSGFTIQ